MPTGRKPSIIEILFVFLVYGMIDASLAFSLQASNYAGFDSIRNELRIVNVCVLNDARFPVEDSLIAPALSQASLRIQDSVGVSFRDIEHHLYADSIIENPYYYDVSLREICSPSSEVKIIVTNVPYYLDERVGSDAGPPEIDTILVGGYADPSYGYLVVYSFEVGLAKRDSIGNSEIVMRLQHELIHLFGLTNHQLLCGLWTPEVIGEILRNKHRRWRR